MPRDRHVPLFWLAVVGLFMQTGISKQGDYAEYSSQAGIDKTVDYLHLWPPSRMTTITYYHWTSYLDWERMTH